MVRAARAERRNNHKSTSNYQQRGRLQDSDRNLDRGRERPRPHGTQVKGGVVATAFELRSVDHQALHPILRFA